MRSLIKTYLNHILILIYILLLTSCSTFSNNDQLTKSNFRKFIKVTLSEDKFYTAIYNQDKVIQNYIIKPTGKDYAIALGKLNKEGKTKEIEAKSLVIEINPPTNSPNQQEMIDLAINEIGYAYGYSKYIKYITSSSNCRSKETQTISNGEWQNDTLTVNSKDQTNYYNSSTLKHWVLFFNNPDDIKNGIYTKNSVSIEPFWEIYYNEENRRKNPNKYPHKIVEKPNSFGCDYFSSYRSLYKPYENIKNIKPINKKLEIQILYNFSL